MTYWSKLASKLVSRNSKRLLPKSEGCYLMSNPHTIAADQKEARAQVASSTLISMGIYDNNSAKAFVERLLPSERTMLYDIMKRKKGDQYSSVEVLDTAEVHHEDLVMIWYINFIPFCGYGMLDNCSMIVVGESVDRTVGLYVGISIMAAAALGNIASNILGFGLVHYVEVFLVRYFNLRSPNLTQKQLNHWSVRFISNLGKVCGLIFGCILGMFPLLFYDSPERLPPPRSVECDENEAINADLEMHENDFSKTGHERYSKLETVAKTLNVNIFAEYKQFSDDWNRLAASDDGFIVGEADD